MNSHTPHARIALDAIANDLLIEHFRFLHTP